MKVDETDSGQCPMEGLDINSVEPQEHNNKFTHTLAQDGEIYAHTIFIYGLCNNGVCS
jgi:hypothetical protein